MECESFAEIAGELARDGLMESTMRASALEHARACSTCGLRLASERRLSRALAFAAEAEVESAPQSVKAALLRSFTEQRAVAMASNRVLEAKRPRARRFLQAVAAALLILLAALTFYMMRSRATGRRSLEQTSPPFVAVNPLSPAQRPPEPPPVGGTEIVRKPGPSERHRDPRTKSLKPQLASSRIGNTPEPMPESRIDSEAMTDFIPLTYLTRSTAIESGQVMRVKMPVSTFIALGVPINNQHADELVSAELVIGDDGVMRAVRLLK